MGILNFFKKNSSLSQKKAENTALPPKKLSVAEIQFLQYLSNHDTNIATFKKYFSLNYEDTVSLLLKNNYMRIGSAEESLSLNTVQDLKKFLKLKDLSLSGKKEDLMQRILSETTDYDTYFSKRIFILTEKGLLLMNMK